MPKKSTKKTLQKNNATFIISFENVEPVVIIIMRQTCCINSPSRLVSSSSKSQPRIRCLSLSLGSEIFLHPVALYHSSYQLNRNLDTVLHSDGIRIDRYV